MSPRAVIGNGNHIGPVAAQATSSAPVTRHARLLCVAARHNPDPERGEQQVEDHGNRGNAGPRRRASVPTVHASSRGARDIHSG